jgi:hypothetical protein
MALAVSRVVQGDGLRSVTVPFCQSAASELLLQLDRVLVPTIWLAVLMAYAALKSPPGSVPRSVTEMAGCAATDRQEDSHRSEPMIPVRRIAATTLSLTTPNLLIVRHILASLSCPWAFRG